MKKTMTIEDHRMRLFVEAYVKSLHLNNVLPCEEAKQAVCKFDQFFQSAPRRKRKGKVSA